MRLGLSSGLAYGGFVPSSINLLDFSPAVAYSLRSFDSSADPNVVNVRRSSDNATQDFKASEITDGTLATYVGSGNDGHVTTWYDQSGNSNHASQTTAASQPKIVSSGAVITESSKPVVKFDGSNDLMKMVLPSSISQPTHSFLVHNFHGTPSAFDGIVGSVGAADAYNEHRLIVSGSLKYNLQAGGGLSYSDYQTSDTLASYRIEQNNCLFRINGSDVASTSGGGIQNEALDGLLLGAINANPAASGNSPVNIKELVVYPRDEAANQTAIETNINAHYSIF